MHGCPPVPGVVVVVVLVVLPVVATTSVVEVALTDTDGDVSKMWEIVSGTVFCVLTWIAVSEALFTPWTTEAVTLLTPFTVARFCAIVLAVFCTLLLLLQLEELPTTL